jgi:response regulator RpfG family c-di-GMP phosphodiesterase
LVGGSGKHFDPDCVKAFLNAWEEVLEIRERYQEDPDSILASAPPPASSD